MELWQGELPDFIDIVRRPKLAEAMATQYLQINRRQPSDAEYTSWERSLAALADVADEAVTDDIGVLVEYHLPLSERRIDVMFFGRRTDGRRGSLLVELKRWTEVSLEDQWARNVLIGGSEHVHPCEQALDYAGYLSDVHSVYADSDFAIQPCAYCHEMSAVAGEPLSDPRFKELIARSPLFLSGDEGSLAAALNEEVGGGHGVGLMHEIRAGMFKPGRRIVESLNTILHHDEEWHLLDEQRKAFNAVWAEVQRVRAEPTRSAILIRGGPGTGKSVIAVQLLAAALREGLKAAHATGGKAFTTVMRGTFTGASPLFVWNRHLRNAPSMGLDLLLTDEAHRIRETSDDRFTPKGQRRRRSQIDELLDAAKVAVFFLDEHQYMRPDEIGNTRLVVEATERRRIPLRQYDLATQFRCGGSREYIAWVDWLLGFRSEIPEDFRSYYRFEVAGDPYDLDTVLQIGGDGSARLVAGFCWKWADPAADGTLTDDVVIGDWRRPWNRKEAKNRTYPPARHPYTLWATTSDGEGQVGCIYSAQGFEFDRVGVVWGADLVWRNGKWVGQRDKSKDPGMRRARGDDFTRLVRHAYRVLLTRGITGTRVLCLDPETNEHMIRCLSGVGRRVTA